MTDFTIKEGDLLPEIQCSLSSLTSGAIPNLSGATVRFIMTIKGAVSTKVDAPAEIVDAAGGIVKYAWVTGDTDTAAKYIAEWEVTFPSGKPETFPNFKNMDILVFKDLGGLA